MFRVKEINGVFIPQKWSWYYLAWAAIDKGESKYEWFSNKYQIDFCSHKTLEGARETIQKYKEKNKKPKYIIHKA